MLTRLVPFWTSCAMACLWWLAVFFWPLQANAQTAAAGGPLVEQIVGDIEPDALVRVKVNGLREWSDDGRQSAWRLVPHVDGRPLPGVYPSGVSLREGWLQFHLRVTPANESNWVDLLSPPVFDRFVPFSIGLEQGDAFPSHYQPGSDHLVRVIVIRRGWAATAAGLVVAFTLAFVYLAMHTRLLFEPMAADSRDGRWRLSLAKVQFALWFFTVFTAFLTIWLTTGRTDSLNSSIVAILGISSGTALGESILRGRSPPAGTANPALPDANANKCPGVWVLLRDLACDAHGASIYRFQVLAWTALLLITFVSQVYFDLSMPAFGPELLYLLGLSSGTYIAQGAPTSRRWDSPPMPTLSQTTTAATEPPSAGAPPQVAAMPSKDSATRIADLAQRMRGADTEPPRPSP